MMFIEPTPATRYALRASQRGSTLIITLFMLLLVMLMGLGMVRSSTADERLAGNFRDRDRAFQAAESAVQKCLQYVQAGTYTTSDGILLTPAGSAAAQNWDDSTGYWADSHSIEIVVDQNAGTGTTGALFSNPRCMVETLGTDNYRVTGRGWGGSGTTDVILQATFTSSGI